VKRRLTEFGRAVEEAVPAAVALNLYDTRYYRLADGRTDFTSTGACFQVVAGGDIYTGDEAAALLNPSVNPHLSRLFTEYGVQSIEPCVAAGAGGGSEYSLSAVEWCVLAVAAAILVGGVLALFVLSCHWSRYQRQRRRRQRRLTVQQVTIPTPVLAPGSIMTPAGTRQPSVVGEGNYSFPAGPVDGAMYSTVHP